MTTRRLENLLGWILAGILVSTIVVFPGYHQPFGTTSVILFLALTQAAFPLYLVLIGRHGHASERFRHPLVLAFAAFMLVLVVSSGVGVDPYNSLLGTTQRTESVLIYLHGFLAILYARELFLFTPVWKRRLTTTLIAVAGLAALYSLLEGWLLPSFIGQNDRAASLFGNPIFFASFLFLPLTFTFARACEPAQRYRSYYILLAVIMLGGILLSGTRGAVVGLIAGGLVFALSLPFTRPRPLQTLCKTLGALAIVLGFLFAAAWMAPDTTAIGRLTQWSDTNVTSRLTYWKMGLTAWTQNPWLGLGPGNFYRAADQLFTEQTYEITEVWPDKPHNILIEWLATTGIIGFGLYAVLLVLLAREILKREKDTPTLVLFAGLIAYIVQGQFVFHSFAEVVSFLFLIAWLTTARAIKPTTDRHGLSPSCPPGIAMASGVLAALTGFLLFTFPYHTLMYAIGQGERASHNDVATALSWYRSAASQRIIVQDIVIAQKYLKLIQRLTQTSTEVDVAMVNEAIDQFRFSVARHPTRARLWNDLAFLLYLKVRLEDAPVNEEGLQAAKRAVELAPGRFEPKRMLAIIYTHNGELDEAEALIATLLDREPAEPSLLLVRSEIAYKRGDLRAAALDGYQAVLNQTSSPSKEQILFFVGLLEPLSEYEKIVDVFELWLNSHPDDPTFLPNLAAAYAAAGDVARAMETAQRLKELDPSMAKEADAFIQSVR